MKLTKINYKELNAKQKEIYNFQVVAGQLAEYGFNCIKLSDDWGGADFLAVHCDGDLTLKVQLKARPTVSKKYTDKDICIAFPIKKAKRWYLVEHDILLDIFRENVGKKGEEVQWNSEGVYSTAKPSVVLERCLSEYALG
ncbi:hypothetical protein [Sneathiella aquimaris]|uniref:hypothetical protein n=1 Tax=Sneathiella aquimaris TaxID=2599305 RepID=UPI00146C4E35|nr:hypothetical protein [Sneathiella aquimaris]